MAQFCLRDTASFEMPILHSIKKKRIHSKSKLIKPRILLLMMQKDPYEKLKTYLSHHQCVLTVSRKSKKGRFRVNSMHVLNPVVKD